MKEGSQLGTCHLCGSDGRIRLLDFGEQSFAHDYLAVPDAEGVTHELAVAVCPRCGLIQIEDPAPPEALYDEYVCLSAWKNQPHVPMLIDMLRDTAVLDSGAAVFEAACNDGSFLVAMREAGFLDVRGLEPAADARAAALARGIDATGGFLARESARAIADSHGPFDLFVARQVVEHVADLDAFGDAMETLSRPGTWVLIEVPDHDFSLDATDYSVYWEEHVNYFGEATLLRWLADHGVEPVRMERVVFSGMTLVVLGRYTGDAIASPAWDVEGLVGRALAHRDAWPEHRDALIRLVRDAREAGKKVAAYGAGNRTNSVINLFGLSGMLEFVADDQQEKQGLYMPGSRLPIVPSERLIADGVDVCLLGVNAENEEKVVARHSQWAAGGGAFFSVLPPSDLLAPIGAWGPRA